MKPFMTILLSPQSRNIQEPLHEASGNIQIGITFKNSARNQQTGIVDSIKMKMKPFISKKNLRTTVRYQNKFQQGSFVILIK